MSKGKLYICGTPIGNLEDITLRTLRILKEVDLIAAEDTRRTKQLLNSYDIEGNLTSYHEHNAKDKAEILLSKLEAGLDIALVSDAGMPLISDPGYRLVKLLADEGVEVVPIPGPTAMTTALVVSGLPSDRFVFEGFLPRKGSDRVKHLEGLTGEERTMIFYEAPHRLLKTLKDILEVLGDREMVVCRELTKKFEEKARGKVSQLIDKFAEKRPKGEIAIVIEGGVKKEIDNYWEDLSILEHLKFEMEEGLTKKKAIKKVAKQRDLPKSEVYQIGTKIKIDR
ncbi:16S rRNA (cytidine(1402)-2'-O)-methyltransferase [Halonatronum saccharophilum]|uniref:16S rRNA (cytidine(1402)-2'-O)-methyltransferase n=1 Tax=Halonatronum saccharophilum TaxID=150060 RepID=UPI0004847B49|nr:16S rRNA (cytidine(1402)-2'-O)-methyltransferase [Halonatronum saccharophilum]